MLSNFKVYFTIAFIGLIIFGYTQCQHVIKLKKEVRNKETIINDVETSYKDKEGRFVSEKITWQIETSDLKEANELYKLSLKDSSIKISKQQKDLARLYGMAESQGKRLKDLESAHIADMEVINNLKTKLRILTDSTGHITGINIDTVKTKHLELSFIFNPPYDLEVKHKYSNSIGIIVDVHAKRKKDGSKQFPFGNSRFLWGSETSTSVMSEDTAAKIVNTISVKIKGKEVK